MLQTTTNHLRIAFVEECTIAVSNICVVHAKSKTLSSEVITDIFGQSVLLYCDTRESMQFEYMQVSMQ